MQFIYVEATIIAVYAVFMGVMLAWGLKHAKESDK
jgi:hypothetical protein